MCRVMHCTLTHTNVITVFSVKVHQMIRQKTRAATNPGHMHSPSDQSGLFKPPCSPHHTLLCTALPCCCLLPTPALWSFAILPAPHFYKKHSHIEGMNTLRKSLDAKPCFKIYMLKYYSCKIKILNSTQELSDWTKFNVTGGELELFQWR